ncbi:MAG: hypothetical protein LBV54_07530, partial [Puniceicoccales bacterium]|nr:hypothetical protein [Puniceicoccales bacterium]
MKNSRFPTRFVTRTLARPARPLARLLSAAAALAATAAFGPSLAPELHGATEADFSRPDRIISISFGDQALNIGSPGAVSVAYQNWNTPTSTTGSLAALKDNTGSVTGVSASWSSFAFY